MSDVFVISNNSSSNGSFFLIDLGSDLFLPIYFASSLMVFGLFPFYPFPRIWISLGFVGLDIISITYVSDCSLTLFSATLDRYYNSIFRILVFCCTYQYFFYLTFRQCIASLRTFSFYGFL